MSHNKTIGQQGEDLACDFLQKQGYEILGRNIKTSFKEIDIVARQGEELIFVEVKTRSSLAFGEAVDAMTPRKTEHIRRAISLFLAEKGRYLEEKIKWKNIRADLVAVDIDAVTKIPKISHYQDII